MTDTAPSSAPPSGFDQRFDYRVDILARRNEITVSTGGVELARSNRSLLVDEQDHALVFYLPRGDVRMDLLAPTDRDSVCPYKGTATNWRLADGDDALIAWTYEHPIAQVARIAGHVGFYQDRVTLTVGHAPYNGPR